MIRGTLHLAVPLDACTGKPCAILDLLAFNPEFTTLVSLVKSADLVELLSKVFVIIQLIAAPILCPLCMLEAIF